MRITIATLKKVARPHGINIEESRFSMDGVIEISTPEGKQFDTSLHALCFSFYRGDGGRANAIAEAIDEIKCYTPLKDCPSDCDCLQR